MMYPRSVVSWVADVARFFVLTPREYVAHVSDQYRRGKRLARLSACPHCRYDP